VTAALSGALAIPYARPRLHCPAPRILVVEMTPKSVTASSTAPEQVYDAVSARRRRCPHCARGPGPPYLIVLDHCSPPSTAGSACRDPNTPNSGDPAHLLTPEGASRENLEQVHGMVDSDPESGGLLLLGLFRRSAPPGFFAVRREPYHNATEGGPLLYPVTSRRSRYRARHRRRCSMEETASMNVATHPPNGQKKKNRPGNKTWRPLIARL